MQRVLLIDAFNLFIRNFTVVTIMNDNGEHYGGVIGFLRSIRSLILELHPDTVIVCWDGENAGLRRKQLYREYKQNRMQRVWKRGLVRSYDFLSQDEEQESFRFQYSKAIEYVSCFPVKQIRIPYVEADDVISYIYYKNPEAKFIIYSSDKDFYQLLSNRCACYNPYTRKIFNWHNFADEFGYPLNSHLVVRAISGDKSDNIDGVKGIGPKTAVQMFPHLFDAEMTGIKEVVGETRKILSSKKKVGDLTPHKLGLYQKILDNEEILYRNYSLMRLDSHNISPQAKTEIIRELKNEITFNRKNFRLLLLRDLLGTVIDHPDTWLSVFSYLNVQEVKI